MERTAKNKVHSANGSADGSAGNGSSNGAKRRGFAAMSPDQQRAIASKGGKVVSENRSHMASIGRKGGVASHGGGRRKAVEAAS